ncbi:MAG: PLP-dependent aminotransferase family protein [Firmicutes bacterium]|nr:PLP-dependent aminotransferase family protein [Bacillota bacterium]
MDNLFEIKIDKASSLPVYQQIGDAIFSLIENGTLAPNSKLPAIRKMASSLEVNNVTIVSAYKYLESKKAVYSHTGSGTYVSPIPVKSIPSPVINENVQLSKSSLVDGAINFTDTTLPQTLFPTDEFKMVFNELLDRENGRAFAAMDSQGYYPLRQTLCTVLKHYGITASPESIQILSGGQQGIDIVAKAILTHGDVVFTEKPTFYGATGAFLYRGCQIVEIPMENDGCDITALENLAKLYRPKIFYMMSYFQTPTGISYSLEKKRKILDLAEKYNFYVIEDDNLYDFNYTKEKILPLKALDFRNRVVYIKSFSKILMPGLRIGFAVMPKKIHQSLMSAKYTADISTSGLIQKLLDIYLNNYDWQAHIETIRTYAMKKYKTAIKYCDRYLPDAKYIKPKGSIGIWIDTGIENQTLFAEKLMEKNIIVSQGIQFMPSEANSTYIRLCFSNINDEKLEKGIRNIGMIIKEMKEK